MLFRALFRRQYFHFIDILDSEPKIFKIIRLGQKAKDCSVILKLCFGFCLLNLLGSYFQAFHDYIVLKTVSLQLHNSRS